MSLRSWSFLMGATFRSKKQLVGICWDPIFKLQQLPWPSVLGVSVPSPSHNPRMERIQQHGWGEELHTILPLSHVWSWHFLACSRTVDVPLAMVHSLAELSPPFPCHLYFIQLSVVLWRGAALLWPQSLQKEGAVPQDLTVG